jgi:hypothetical protein
MIIINAKRINIIYTCVGEFINAKCIFNLCSLHKRVVTDVTILKN